MKAWQEKTLCFYNKPDLSLDLFLAFRGRETRKNQQTVAWILNFCVTLTYADSFIREVNIVKSGPQHHSVERKDRESKEEQEVKSVKEALMSLLKLEKWTLETLETLSLPKTDSKRLFGWVLSSESFEIDDSNTFCVSLKYMITVSTTREQEIYRE